MAKRGGARAGAGRKSAREERLILDVVNKCWERVYNNITGNRLSDEQKDIIALEVVKRTAPKNIDLTSKGEQLFPLNGFNYVKPGDNTNDQTPTETT